MDNADNARLIVDNLALNPLDPKELIATVGLLGIWGILFAETGLLVGFFFPGDSLLFLAGVAASTVAEELLGEGVSLSLPGLLIGAPIAAIVGAQLGHWLGAKYGRRMFERPESKLFKKDYVDKAEFYFNKYGPAKAVVLARFIPVVRTFLNPVAGMLGMPAKQFLMWNVIGAILWTDGIILAGYLLAAQINRFMDPEDIDHYLLPVILLIVLISVLPVFVEFFRERRAKAKEAAAHARTAEAEARIVEAEANIVEAVEHVVEAATQQMPAVSDPHNRPGQGGGQVYGSGTYGTPDNRR
ncbi:membrane-associated protein [Catenuloplanes nepalensis]|uniref:Membrane-associated protein n=1 Tax=Catenuloplanes nepalensis TaxID=587533 RepID=A0ABT9N3V0_9ACTN|nr:DedA family protein [Catenuloplanes nepalensis]MDP9798380.1 membrane-associated protein [Catenuloplanes nepalensis]